MSITKEGGLNPTKLQRYKHITPFRGPVLNWGQGATVAGVNHADMLLSVLQSEFCRSLQICADLRDASVLGVKRTLFFLSESAQADGRDNHKTTAERQRVNLLPFFCSPRHPQSNPQADTHKWR